MLSVNLALRKLYLSVLTGIIYDGNPVKVFWGQVPTTVGQGIYISYGQINNVDDSPKTSSMTETSVTVSIYTNSLKYNDGVAVEVVANEVLNRLYRTPTYKIVFPDEFFQMIKTKLVSDRTQDYFEVGANTYIDRILIFNHTIFQNVS